MTELAVLHFNESEMHFLLESQHGPVGVLMGELGEIVVGLAKQYTRGAGGGPHIRSGELNASIHHDVFEDSEGLHVNIGTDITSPRQAFEYPLALELGGVNGNTPYRYPFLRPALEDVFGKLP